MKKICIIYANCQNRLLAECLSKSTLFNQEYLIKRFPAHLLIQGKKTIPEQILKKAKLFIYQPVKEVHGKASSEYILSQLSPDCQTISFPSLYFTGYFPQHYKKPNKRIVKSIYPFGIIPEGDLNVANMLEQGQNPNQIIEQLQHQDFYTSEFLRANVDSSLAELARRESSLDIKVSQFIRDNYQQQRLFYVHNHPTDILGFYITNLILNKINLPQFDTQDLAANPAAGILDNTQVPIYPSVIKHLQLSFTQNITYKHNRFCTNNLTFERYIQEYINLDQLVTGSSGGFYFAGIKHLAKNKYSLAEKSLKEAIKINPQNAAYYRELGKVYEQQQQLDRAELVYKKAISISPDWINFYHFLGKILVIKQDFSQAALVYQQAIKLKPESGELYALLGETLVNLERLDLAAKCYQRAIQISPQKSGNYRCLGDIYRQQNSLEQAVIYYEQAIAIAPQNPWPYIHLSETLIAQNKFEEANKTCKQSLKFNHGKKAGIYRRVSNLQLKIGSVDDALNTYQKAVKLNPNHADKIFEQLGSKMKENATA